LIFYEFRQRARRQHRLFHHSTIHDAIHSSHKTPCCAVSCLSLFLILSVIALPVVYH
jgi:hypothetical protein